MSGRLRSIMLGRGTFRIDEYSSYVTDITAVLPDSKKIKYSVNCSLSNNISFSNVSNILSPVVLDKILSGYDLFINASFIQANQRVMNILFGNDGNDSDFYFCKENYETNYRIEMVFTYPNNTNTMTVIIPKARISSVSDTSFINLKEPFKPTLQFQSIGLDNDTWLKKLGRVIFA